MLPQNFCSFKETGDDSLLRLGTIRLSIEIRSIRVHFLLYTSLVKNAITGYIIQSRIGVQWEKSNSRRFIMNLNQKKSLVRASSFYGFYLCGNYVHTDSHAREPAVYSSGDALVLPGA